jgi:prepilin-type N-terminal cleavage/methylation domain-containing protein
MRTGRMKRGFTLIETVVTVGIVAAMAAVVIPQVAKQFDAADPTRVQNDLKNLQTAVETFNVNVKQLPGDLDDLVNPIVAGDFSSATHDTSFATTGLVAVYGNASLWQGPYMDFSTTTGATLETGFGAAVLDDFVCYIASGTGANTAGDALTGNKQGCTGNDATSRMFLAVRLTGLGTTTDDRFIALNDLFDGTSAAEVAARATLGRVRLLTVATVPTVFFLITPLN